MNKNDIRKIVTALEGDLGASEKEGSGYRFPNLETAFGAVSVILLPPQGNRRGRSPWLACRLKGWDAPQGRFNWYGWDHWKQNMHLSGGCSWQEWLRMARLHLGAFDNDQGQGFPKAA